MVGDYLHAELHAVIGGAWGSKLDLGHVTGKLEFACDVEMANNDTIDGSYYSSCETIKYIEDWAANINVFARAAFAAARANTTHMREWYSCPDAKACTTLADVDGPGDRGAPKNASRRDDSCQCSSPALTRINQSDPDHQAPSIQAYMLLDNLGLAAEFATRYGSDLPSDVTDDDYVKNETHDNVTEAVDVSTVSFNHISDADAEILWSTLANWIAAPPHFGPMSATLAAPNDPIFWVIHNTWERFWAKKLLTPSLMYLFDWTWYNSSDTCWAYSYHAVLPFHDLLSDNERPHDFNESRGYTNQQLMKLFDPANPNLPYVYETLGFDHCGDKDTLTMETTKLFKAAKESGVEAVSGNWLWDASDDEETQRTTRRGDMYHRLWDLARRWGQNGAY